MPWPRRPLQGLKIRIVIQLPLRVYFFFYESRTPDTALEEAQSGAHSGCQRYVAEARKILD